MHLADIVGVGRTKTAEHWSLGLVDLAVEAGGAALDEAACRPTAVVVGNALGSALGDQRNLAAYVAAHLGLSTVESISVEADEASGGAALRLALALIRSDLHEQVLVIGAEKTTDALPDRLEAARANGLEVLQEAGFGVGLPVAAALTMRRYIEEHNVDRSEFYHLSALAHAHGARNEMAFFSWPLSMKQYLGSPVVADPITVCDTAPPCDGAAAVMVRRADGGDKKRVRITGSSSISNRPGISGPSLDLKLPAAQTSAADAMAQAKVELNDISVFELHDSSTIMAALSLEAVGLSEPGQALALAAGDALTIDGPHPTWTFGGHKARGHTLGASGLYQVVEAALQLRSDAGDNQVRGAETALVQSLGSFGSTAITHILSR
ncbi:MAG: thiolase family protein [Proteobacteria bacterium]|nr:thiolase family protein [Pseudomonadota bacterium]